MQFKKLTPRPPEERVTRTDCDFCKEPIKLTGFDATSILIGAKIGDVASLAAPGA